MKLYLLRVSVDENGLETKESKADHSHDRVITLLGLRTFGTSPNYNNVVLYFGKNDMTKEIPFVSPEQCKIYHVIDKDGHENYHIKDTSRYGTYVNDVRLPKYHSKMLNLRDKIHFGHPDGLDIKTEQPGPYPKAHYTFIVRRFDELSLPTSLSSYDWDVHLFADSLHSMFVRPKADGPPVAICNQNFLKRRWKSDLETAADKKVKDNNENVGPMTSTIKKPDSNSTEMIPSGTTPSPGACGGLFRRLFQKEEKVDDEGARFDGIFQMMNEARKAQNKPEKDFEAHHEISETVDKPQTLEAMLHGLSVEQKDDEKKDEILDKNIDDKKENVKEEDNVDKTEEEKEPKNE